MTVEGGSEEEKWGQHPMGDPKRQNKTGATMSHGMRPTAPDTTGWKPSAAAREDRLAAERAGKQPAATGQSGRTRSAR